MTNNHYDNNVTYRIRNSEYSQKHRKDTHLSYQKKAISNHNLIFQTMVEYISIRIVSPTINLLQSYQKNKSTTAVNNFSRNLNL